MKIEVDNIYVFKLTSGQEVVGKVTAITDELYELDRPLTVGQGPQGLELVPITAIGQHLADSSLFKTAIAMALPIREDVLSVYEQSIDPEAVHILTPDTKQIITG